MTTVSYDTKTQRKEFLYGGLYRVVVLGRYSPKIVLEKMRNSHGQNNSLCLISG
jgi:hypothetical protein